MENTKKFLSFRHDYHILFTIYMWLLQLSTVSRFHVLPARLFSVEIFTNMCTQDVLLDIFDARGNDHEYSIICMATLQTLCTFLESILRLL